MDLKFCCYCLIAQSCPTLSDPMNCNTPGVWLDATSKALCTSPSPRVFPNSRPLHQWFHPAISSSDSLFSLCQSFPASGTFLMSWLLSTGDQNTGASVLVSVLPMSIQGWFPLTVFISLLFKALSGDFSSTTAQRYQFWGALPSLWSGSHNHTGSLGRP